MYRSEHQSRISDNCIGRKVLSISSHISARTIVSVLKTCGRRRDVASYRPCSRRYRRQLNHILILRVARGRSSREMPGVKSRSLVLLRTRIQSRSPSSLQNNHTAHSLTNLRRCACAMEHTGTVRGDVYKPGHDSPYVYTIEMYIADAGVLQKGCLHAHSVSNSVYL